MSAAGGHLAVRPELCDRCGLCVRACPKGHLRVGGGYIYVDASECDGCFNCVEVCVSGAIVRRNVPSRPTAMRAGASVAEVGRMVVGSRAEAKALRKAAEVAEKQRAKAGSSVGPVAAPRSASPREGVSWGFADAGVVGAVLLAALLAKETLLRSEYVAVMPAGGQVAARALALGAFWFVQIAVLVHLSRRRGSELAPAFRLTRHGGAASEIVGGVGLVALLLLGTLVASVAWGAFARAIGWSPPSSETLQGVFGGGGGGLAIAIATVVILAPFAEELVFRGVIATALVDRWGMRWAVLGSAAVFALYHITPWVFVPRFVLGCALAWLALSRRTLWPAIALHALHNGVVVGAAFWLPPT